MKLIDRYILKAFFGPLGVCLVIFCVLVVIGRFFDKMQIFNNYHAHLKDILVYLTLGLPFWLNLVFPVATMLAVLFSLGQLNQRGELTACRSAGIATLRLLMPYFAVGFLLSILSLAGGLTFLPRCNFAARAVYRVKIKQQGQVLSYQSDHIVAAGRNNRRFTIDSLDIAKGEMKNVIVDRFDANSEWLESITGREAFYKDGHWVFMNGVWRKSDPAHPGPIVEQSFAQMAVDIPEKPEDFATEDKNPEDMTGREILTRIKRLAQKGVSVSKETMAFHMKIALPFANLVVIALAIPFALKGGRNQNRAQTFTYALVLAFLYWGVTSVCQSLGEQGRMPGWVAAWTANFLFSIYASWKLLQST